MKSLRFPLNLLLAILFSLAIMPTANAQYPKWFYGASGYAKAIEVQRELNVSLVVYFYTDWCPYCRTLDSQYLLDPSVHRALQRSVAVRINPEYGPEEKLIADRFGVRSYPAFLIMDNESAPPKNVNPFRKNGDHLTPQEFARACEQAMTFLPMPAKVTRDESKEAMDRVKYRHERLPKHCMPSQ